MTEEQGSEERKRTVVANSLLFKGPTVVAALVCAVAAVFSMAVGAVIATNPQSLEGTFLVDFASGNSALLGLLSGIGVVMLALGAAYVASAVLLWSETHWVRGVYLGIVVSIVGMVWSGLETTFAPGVAAAGMIVNVMIITLLATETWEARRGSMGGAPMEPGIP